MPSALAVVEAGGSESRLPDDLVEQIATAEPAVVSDQ
jgi:hypothetical protein